MPTKLKSSESQIKLYDESQSALIGGETRPFQYPRLYQIQAGDWRISYAVEHNRLAILVLEVLTPEGYVRKDPNREKLAQKMKVKLLDWSKDKVKEGTTAEEIGKKLKVKLLDLSTDIVEEGTIIEETPRKSKIKLFGTSGKQTDKKPASEEPSGKRRITLLGSTQPPTNTEEEETAPEEQEIERKVTPVDSPTQ